MRIQIQMDKSESGTQMPMFVAAAVARVRAGDDARIGQAVL